MYLRFGPSSSTSSSLAISIIHSAFSLCFFLVAIFSSKIVRFLWRLVVGMFLCHAIPIVDEIFFRSFGMSCFACIVLLFMDISLVFLLLLEPSGLFPQVVLFFPVLSFPFSSHIF